MVKLTGRVRQGPPPSDEHYYPPLHLGLHLLSQTDFFAPIDTAVIRGFFGPTRSTKTSEQELFLAHFAEFTPVSMSIIDYPGRQFADYADRAAQYVDEHWQVLPALQNVKRLIEARSKKRGKGVRKWPLGRPGYEEYHVVFIDELSPVRQPYDPFLANLAKEPMTRAQYEMADRTVLETIKFIFLQGLKEGVLVCWNIQRPTKDNLGDPILLSQTGVKNAVRQKSDHDIGIIFETPESTPWGVSYRDWEGQPGLALVDGERFESMYWMEPPWVEFHHPLWGEEYENHLDRLHPQVSWAEAGLSDPLPIPKTPDEAFSSNNKKKEVPTDGDSSIFQY